MDIAEDNAYPLTVSPVSCYHNRLLLPNLQIYCRRRYLSTDTFHSQSTVGSNQCTWIGVPPRPLWKQHMILHYCWFYCKRSCMVRATAFPTTDAHFPNPRVWGNSKRQWKHWSQRGDNSGQIYFFRDLSIHCHWLPANSRFGSRGGAHFFNTIV